MHFYVLVEVLLLLLLIFLVVCATAAAGTCAACNISTMAESGTGYSFLLLRSVLYTAMLRTSIAAVVLCCFYLCPLDCDASVIVVDCAAVETGCMLEKYHKSPFLRIRYFQCCFRCVYYICLLYTSPSPRDS